tara:strand:+ start:99 stop:932 length:834 start_codon:yes stop_codon:yes gene_type:complete
MTNDFISPAKRCAPGKKYSNGSCFTIEQLKSIAKQTNKQHPSININYNHNNKKELVRTITKVLKNKYDCDNDLCWLNLDVVKDLNDEEINNFTFRPPGPDRGTKWLNTTDINQVLEQYTRIYPDFISFSAVPLDFKTLDHLKMKQNENNLENLWNRGIRQIGIVFNHDYSNMGGSHWVGLYINLSNGNIYYFDSYGTTPKKEVLDYINIIKHFMTSKRVNSNYKYNNIRHQFKGSECGVYSINFILRLLKGESFKEITTNITTDDDVNLCRQVYFTP